MQIAKFKGGFTLFELMIVIIIIGIVYALVAVKFTQNRDKKVKLSDLPEILRNYDFKQSAEIICIKEKCRQCNVYLDETPLKKPVQLFKSEPVTYRLLPDETLQEIEFEPIIDEEQRSIPVCFRDKVTKNGAGDEVVIDDGKGALLMFAYNNPMHFDDIESARDKMIEIKQKAYE